jgi:hypothetical protein
MPVEPLCTSAARRFTLTGSKHDIARTDVTIRFDSSWDPSTFWLWNWLTASSLASDNELRNRITSLHAKARKKYAKLNAYPPDSQRAIVMAEWKRVLDDLDEMPVTYAQAFGLDDELAAILSEIEDTLQTEAAERAEEAEKARKAKPAVASSSASSSITAKPASSTAPKTSKMSAEEMDDLATLAAHYKPSSTTATKPILITPRPARTPQDDWRDAQRTMRNQCDDVASRLNPGSRASAGFGAHAVTQGPVLSALPNIPGATWGQGRPDNSGAEVRVMVAVVDGKVVRTVWTNGLSHDASRRANTYTVYEQDGNSARFTLLSTTKHPKDV